MTMQTEHIASRLRSEPWKAMAVAAGAGAGLMAELIAGATLLLRAVGR